mmetsp:Transcript_11701/g.31913  ORF Transcript_11701/g.31913 Transcript_11701/m.31913 type:complete len:116 (-) Transcript_11701:483-830(-)|eukprot:CAMPEP_0202357962 /NCGR_PEP_ID=MMETSP1126-20121109/11785_1 /ASSEMBLY_ACC=CAM_ASM_000457 /TAXON_ID=3047 /ORGANISM="Dunaliella tertiolecta, Strain CCMP1320" /LENGTH=115 /DNA_ID=CAMNT_0048950959 /DNA_START=66 /DNA_END=413 /DNA_ORIENTATION=+
MPRGGLGIHLVRWGFVRRPFFVLAVAKRGVPRNSGKRFEDVGWWDPNKAADGNMHLGLKFDRIKYWMTAGAVPTPKVQGILAKVGLIPQLPEPVLVKPRDPAQDLIKWQTGLEKK